jgi:cytochrome c oxidase assembly protein subunit 15
VRLSDAGLGCPDWPLCYGRPLPDQIADAGALARAWKEMGHRYLAGALGILIFLIAALSWKNRRSRGVSTAILAVVAGQAALGMWTVTMLLKPAIVTAHLLGGMTTLALLLLLYLQEGRYSPAPETRALRAIAALSLAAVAVQIALGGWVSANYAALACPDLPGCMGQVFPPMDFANAFHVLRELGRTGDGELLPLRALTAIHWMHRVFALVALATVGFLVLKACRLPALRGVALTAGALVTVQFLLGVSNVALGLPLPLAAAHNAGAALLLTCLVVLNFFVFRGLSPSR